MKKITFIFLYVLVSFGIQAQTNQQTLLNTTWYLSKIEVDDEIILVPGFNLISDFTLQFHNENNVTEYTHMQCSNLATGSYQVVNENTLTFFNYSVTLALCPIEQLVTFFNTLDNDVFTDNLSSNFQYAISTENDVLQLVITGANGNKVFYYNEATANTKSFHGEILKIYPNPSSDFLNISITDLDHVLIFDMQGKRMDTKLNSNAEEVQIDIQHLAKGTYILQISKDNQTVSLKFIKE